MDDLKCLFRVCRGVYSQTPQMPFNALLRRTILGNFVLIYLDVLYTLSVGISFLLLLLNFKYYLDLVF